MSKYVIALDAMGGDHAPDAIVEGAIRGLRRFRDIDILLTGPEAKLKEFVGHTPLQVGAGIIIGIANACFMHFVIFS